MKWTFKTGLIAIGMAAVFGACSESYPGIIYDDGTSIGSDGTLDSLSLVPVYVYINKQSFFSTSSMRGMGAFNGNVDIDENGNRIEITRADSLLYYTATFHVFAFRDGRFASTGASYPAELASDPDLRWTLWKGQSGTYDKDKINCLVDGNNYYAGLPTQLNVKTGLYPEKEDFLYYGPYQDVGYNFFAYYVDNLASTSRTVHRDKDSIYYDVTIDGTQDLMCGYAPKLTEEVLESRYSELRLMDAERKRVLNIGNYSSYAAHRNIDPYINIHHVLTRLDFRAYPGSESANDVTIEEIAITCPIGGKLVVAHTDPSRVGFYPNLQNEGQLKLHEAPQVVEKVQPDGTVKLELQPCEKLKSEYYQVTWKPEYKNSAVTDREYVKVGGNILAPSQQEYVVTIKAKQNIYDSEGNLTDQPTLVSTYRVQAPEKKENQVANGSYVFQPGRYYTINVVVFGLEDIQVSADIDGWQDGGSIDILPDDAETDVTN